MSCPTSHLASLTHGFRKNPCPYTGCLSARQLRRCYARSLNLELNQKYQILEKNAQPFQKSGGRAPQIEAAAHPASDKQIQKTRLLSNACAAAASPSGRTLTTRGRKPDTGSPASNSKNKSLPSRPARQKIVIMAYLAFTLVPKICVCVFCLTVAFRSHSIPSGNVPANGSIHHRNNHEQQYG